MFKVFKNKNHPIQMLKALILGPLLISVLFFPQNGQAAKTSKSKKQAAQIIQKCQNLSKQLKELKTNQAVKNMSKGFEWVKANMEAEARLPIKQYLEVSEKISFQCPQPKRKKPIANVKQTKPKVKNLSSNKKKQVKSTTKKKIKKKSNQKKQKNTKTEQVSSGNLTTLLEDFFAGPPQPAKKTKTNNKK